MRNPYEYAGKAIIQCSCGESLPLKPCRSAAGWYAGRFCPNCGPYSRESGYFTTEQEAKAMVDYLVNAN